ncbi:hypothetical protein FGL98_24450 [Leekyejoonella antrihumi]|uniref:Uncharacterized protein n=1 Tax=Leekyejoonella antrihumi TaxID=1660198 RepID=A0A563DQU8_9MICO|nr:hypothetical protein FGL98_24450 [Leekyejoonella antrihumi]
MPNLHAIPRWARLWYRIPFIDRYAYEWMWWHGGWSVLVPGDSQPLPPTDGVREPRRPTPTPAPMSGMRDEASGEFAN